MAFSADGKQALIAPGYGGAPQLFDLQSGAEVLRLDEDNTVRGVAFLPGGNQIVTGNAKAVSVWDVQTRQRVQQFTIPGGSLFVMALAPDGKSLVIGRERKGCMYACGMSPAASKCLEFADPAPVNAVALSPDGKYILSGSRDNLARLWEVATGQLVRTFVGHTFWLWGVGFSSDGKHVLTASQDRTARLWDASTGQQLRLFPSHANASVANAIFAPDGRSVVVGSFDGVAQQTPTELNDLIHAVCCAISRTRNTRSMASPKVRRPAQPSSANPITIVQVLRTASASRSWIRSDERYSVSKSVRM